MVKYISSFEVVLLCLWHYLRWISLCDCVVMSPFLLPILSLSFVIILLEKKQYSKKFYVQKYQIVIAELKFKYEVKEDHNFIETPLESPKFLFFVFLSWWWILVTKHVLWHFATQFSCSFHLYLLNINFSRNLKSKIFWLEGTFKLEKSMGFNPKNELFTCLWSRELGLWISIWPLHRDLKNKYMWILSPIISTWLIWGVSRL